MLLSPELMEQLALQAEDQPRIGCITCVLQWWRKHFTESDMPLGQLRGLYADQLKLEHFPQSCSRFKADCPGKRGYDIGRNALKLETEVATLARAGAIKEAPRNLGHTSTPMTENH